MITTCATACSENICATVLEVRRAGAFHSEGIKHDQAGRALGAILVSLVVPRGRARRHVLRLEAERHPADLLIVFINFVACC